MRHSHIKYTLLGAAVFAIMTTLIVMNDKTEPPEKHYPIIAGWTEQDTKDLASLIWLEAGESADDYQQIVASIALNRLKNEDYPDTLHELLADTTDKTQFDSIRCGLLEYATPDDRAVSMATHMLIYGSVLPEEVIYMTHDKPSHITYQIYQHPILGAVYLGRNYI